MVERLIPTLDVSGIAHEVSAREMKRKRSFGYYTDDSGITDSDKKKKIVVALCRYVGARHVRYCTLTEFPSKCSDAGRSFQE